jgi:hypothetical protein
MTGIYKITEISTGLCYIGQSKTIEKRWLKHHKRFPPEFFTYEVLREVKIPQFMNSFEKFYIKLYDSHANGFNGTIGGSAMKVTHPSVETKEKIRLAGIGSKNGCGNKGKKRGPQSTEWIQKRADARKGKPSPKLGKKYGPWKSKQQENIEE